MTAAQAAVVSPGVPRVVRRRVNGYAACLCVGLYLGILFSAWAAEWSGLSPLRQGIGSLAFALAGAFGARFYYLAANWSGIARAGARRSVTSRAGGLGVFGALSAAPVTLASHAVLGIPFAAFWDNMALGIAFGGCVVRFGCVCNGCCVGRATDGWFALRQHDLYGVVARRLPVAWLEIAWWLAAGATLCWLLPVPLPAGSRAWYLLGWYGLGRFWLEPFREVPAVVWRRVRVDQLIAAALVLIACGGLWALARG